MSEENSEPTTLKLKLSRKPNEATEEPSGAPSHAKETSAKKVDTPAPDRRINRQEEESTPQSEALQPPQPQAPDPIKSSEIGKPTTGKADASESLPPKLPAEATDPSGEALEKSVNRVDNSAKSSGSPLLSIFIVMMLLLVLGGSGYGLWFILSSAKDPGADTETSSNTESTSEETKKSGNFISESIAKAKATIATVPDGEADKVIESVSSDPEPPKKTAASSEPPTPATPTPATPTPATAKPATAKPATAKPATAKPATAKPATAPSRANVDAVSDFLTGAHIGGVRAGENPKVMINGQSYSMNELIDADTGLRFAGMRDGKLAFKDAKGIVYLKSF